MDDAFHSKSEQFLSWLRSCGAEISSKIQLADLRALHAGRGVVACSDLEEDEILFRLPRSCVLSVENSELPKIIPDVFQELDPWLSLILVMIYEYCQGDKSKWRSYFEVLPTEFNTLMFWSDDELDQLQASAVRNKIGKASADDTFRNAILPIIYKHAGLFGGEAGTLSDGAVIALAHRMGSTIMAYAFDIEPASTTKEADEEGYVSEDEDEALPKGMVPLADMLNADADRNNARLFYEENCLSMKALKQIKAGEELFNDYGPLPRSDLLRRYGYITDNYAKYDVVEIPLDLVRKLATDVAQLGPSVIKERLSYLDEHDLIDNGYDIAADEPFAVQENIAPELIILVETLLLPQAEFERLKSKNKLPKPEKISLKSAQLLYQLVNSRTAQYPSTIEQDLNEHGQTLTAIYPTSKESRYATARQVRIGEKAILGQAKTALENLVSRLQSSQLEKRPDEQREDRTAKRRRMA